MFPVSKPPFWIALVAAEASDATLAAESSARPTTSTRRAPTPNRFIEASKKAPARRPAVTCPGASTRHRSRDPERCQDAIGPRKPARCATVLRDDVRPAHLAVAAVDPHLSPARLACSS